VSDLADVALDAESVQRDDGLFERINRGLTLVAAALTALFFVLICAQVICRYLLSYSISWSEELSRYAFVWATFVAAAAVAGRGEHYDVTILDNVVPRAVRITFVIVRKLLEAGFAFILACYGTTWALRQMNVSTPVIEANQGLVYSIVPLFGMYLLIQVIRSSLKIIKAPAQELR
jgi:TRAP-type C4-dicarboxylate transport system permease small subunit